MSIAADTHSILKEYGFSASKRFGQNFLKDRSVLEDIVRASGTSKEDIVVEIGPGLGG